MRVSDNMTIDTVARGIARAQSRQLAATREASSGSRISNPSDDPVAAARLARIQASIDQTAAYRSSIATVQGDVELSETTLASASSVFERAQEIALQGANDTMPASERAMLAKEVHSLREQLVSLANTKGSLGYLFGGSATDTAPFDASGNLNPTANSDPHTVEIAQGMSLDVRVDGGKAFTAAGGRDVFADLSALESALNADDGAAIGATVNSLDTSRRQIVAARTDAGDKLNRLSTADAAHDQADTALQSTRHDVADADPAAAYSRLIATQQALESAITVARTTLATLGATRLG
jgi:flagellar hook-associated protein 3 FlgL